MSQTVTVELPDGVYNTVRTVAEATGNTPAEWIALHLPQLLTHDEEESTQFPIPAEILAILQRLAPQLGKTRDELAAVWLGRYGLHAAPPLREEERQAAWEQLQQHCGAVSLGHPTGADNESIDADLAREYSSTHEGQAT
jgi:hypothetical protein